MWSMTSKRLFQLLFRKPSILYFVHMWVGFVLHKVSLRFVMCCCFSVDAQKLLNHVLRWLEKCYKLCYKKLFFVCTHHFVLSVYSVVNFGKCVFCLLFCHIWQGSYHACKSRFENSTLVLADFPFLIFFLKLLKTSIITSCTC